MAQPAVRRGRIGRGEVSMVPEATPTSYYGHPVLKQPVWKPEVAVYLFTGGLAGGSAMLAATARMQGNHVLARRALCIAFAAVSTSPPLLIMDLGVPRRFHNMLRVLKVTSPMSVGSWVLSAAGGAIGVATACEVTGRLPRVQRAAEAGAALLGPALSTYTAVLVSDTAVPIWHEAHGELPFVFAASAMATAGAAAVLVTDSSHAGLARTVAVGGMLAELGAIEVMERRLGDLGEPYHRGEAGRFSRLAKGVGLGGAALLGLGARRRSLAALGGAAILAASFCERWAVYRAGTASASDPRFTVGPQRERLERGG
jgi:Polysulphide reductase, NrfD